MPPTDAEKAFIDKIRAAPVADRVVELRRKLDAGVVNAKELADLLGDQTRGVEINPRASIAANLPMLAFPPSIDAQI